MGLTSVREVFDFKGLSKVGPAHLPCSIRQRRRAVAAYGNLPAGKLVANAIPVPYHAQPQPLYITTTGELSFDPDGMGPTKALILVTLIGVPLNT